MKRKTKEEFESQIRSEYLDKSDGSIGINLGALLEAIASQLWEQQEAIFPPGTLDGDPLTDHQYFERYAVKITGDLVSFFNHDLEVWEEPSQERVNAYWSWRHKMGLAFDNTPNVSWPTWKFRGVGKTRRLVED